MLQAATDTATIGQNDRDSVGPIPAPRLDGEQGALEDLLASVTCNVRLAGSYHFAGHWDVPTRITPQYILCIGAEGEADVTIGSDRYRLARDTVVLLSPHVPQAFVKVADEDLRFYTVHFTARVYGVLDLPSLYGLAPMLRLPPARMVDFVLSARRIVAELAGAKPGCTLAAGGECARMLALLWRETLAHAGEMAPRDTAPAAALAQLAPVFREIQARHAEPLRVRDLARLVHLHPAWFSTRFKRATGLSPARYLIRYRLERARELLLSTDRSVGEVAALTGFPDPLYLSRQFRRLTGESPTSYRRSAGISARLPAP